jgi:HEPN domain-containing protein
MKRREQALLLLRKAAQDETLLDEVLGSHKVGDEVIGFHCQQAAEKLLKAVLSDRGVPFRKTHDVGQLMDLVAASGDSLPEEFEQLEALTPFAVIYRYDAYDSEETLDRTKARENLRKLRVWVDLQLKKRTVESN